MEAQTDITTYLEQGKQALAQGQGREAAIAYAHGAQVEPENPLVHLGLAEANLALGSNGVVLMACRKTQELAPEGPIYHMAQALLELLDRRYAPALQQVDLAIQDDPGNAYAHALRSYLLRANNQTYDAGLARARASRLSIGGKFENCFPPIEPVYANGYQNQPTSFTPPLATPVPAEPVQNPETPSYTERPQQQQQIREEIPSWSRTPRQRQMIRASFWMNQHPRLLTYIIIALTALGFLIVQLFGSSPALYALLQNEFGRLVLSIFMPGDILQLIFNAFSLFFVGSTVEMLYGKWRYLAIYLISGVVGNFVLSIFVPGLFLVGASAAVFGAFGALGAFFIVNRRALGPVANSMLGQWVFWLVLNLVFSFSSGFGISLLLGGLIAGIVLGVLLIPPLRRTGRRVI